MSDLKLPLGTYAPAARRLVAAVILSTLTILLVWHSQQPVGRIVYDTLHSSAKSDAEDETPACRQIPGAEDVLVVMKTGANEIEDKLTVHLNTTLSCYPNHVIFSDYEEDLATGQHVFDAFKYTRTSIKETHRDFALWRKLQSEGRAGLPTSELSGTDSREKSEDIRKKTPGWQLDKWKFLPMLNQTYHLHPRMQWYVFVEADTYIFWSSLLPYLSMRTWTDDQYVGSKAVIEELGFAHGGSGFLLSRSALEKVVKLFNADQEKWEDFTDRYWAGDHILAAALRKAGVLLEDGKPAWQGQPLNLLEFGPTKGLWCSTAITFHHQLPSEIQDLWEFEQSAISLAKGNKPLRHRDLLEQYVLPRIQRPRPTWDNRSGDLRNSDTTSLMECESLCEQDADCLQYAMQPNGHCKTASTAVLGQPSDTVESGWMIRRIQKLLDNSAAC